MNYKFFNLKNRTIGFPIVKFEANIRNYFNSINKDFNN
jgi:hypothetical protein